MPTAQEELREVQNAYRALGEDPKSYTLALTTSAASTGALDPGEYEMWLTSGSSSETVVWKRATTSSTPTVATPDADGEAVYQFAGDRVALVRITATEQYLWAKTLVGTGTLRMSKIGP